MSGNWIKVLNPYKNTDWLIVYHRKTDSSVNINSLRGFSQLVSKITRECSVTVRVMMADHWRESDCNGSQLISCITAVIFTLFITSSMCSVRFKIFKSVICQHYEVNTHTLTPGVQSVTLLSPFTWPCVHHKILTRPFVALAVVFVTGVCNSQRRRKPLNPGAKLKGNMSIWEKKGSKWKQLHCKKIKNKKARKAQFFSWCTWPSDSQWSTLFFHYK